MNAVASCADGLVGDALVSDTKGIWLAVSVADCVPVYLWDEDRQAVGIAHAGWRGTLAGVAGACVRRMQTECGSEPGEMVALVGPGIGPCCFEVSPEVAGQFDELLPGSSSGNHVDLIRANQIALQRLGVSCIACSVLCTSCSEELFFSHRRDKGTTGRMLAMIGAEI